MWDSHPPSGKHPVSSRIAAAAAVFAFAPAMMGIGCASESVNAKPSRSAQTQCVANQILRCLCELDEGFQRCDEDGVLSECDCASSTLPAPKPDASNRPRFDAGSDAPSGDTGPAARCGDGRVDVGEACDDGNNTDDDGCSARCIPDGHPMEAATCPGQAVTLWPVRHVPVVHIVGSTDGFANTAKASCFDSKGPDRVYAITPTKDGVMSIKMNFAETFSAIVSLQDTCATTLTAQHKLFCSDTLGFPMNQLVEVKQDKTYYLVIDGDTATSKGPFELDLSLQ